MKRIWTLLTGIVFILTGCTKVTTPFAPINFKTQTMPDKPNYSLVCPVNYCTAKTAEAAPIYPVSVTTLANELNRFVAKQPRWTSVYEDDLNYRYVYIQRSAIFGFPDTIDVQLVPIDKNQSSIAIFSRAKYGYYDMNVNQKRVQLMLNALSLGVKKEH